MSIPSAEDVQRHAERYPAIDANGAHYGGFWVAQDPDASLGRGFPTILRLCVEGGQVKQWNGFAFAQPLEESRWAARSTFRPVDQNGRPTEDDPLVQALRAVGNDVWPVAEVQIAAALSLLVVPLRRVE